MLWFHTVALPLATLLAVFIGIKKKMPPWKYPALVAGCACMLAGLWLDTEPSTPLLLAGGVVFTLGMPRPAIPRAGKT